MDVTRARGGDCAGGKAAHPTEMEDDGNVCPRCHNKMPTKDARVEGLAETATRKRED